VQHSVSMTHPDGGRPEKAARRTQRASRDRGRALRLPIAFATALVILAGLPGPSAQAATGLVAAYSFDEGLGTTVTDASGNGNTGTLSGPTWTPAGKFNGALSFREDDLARVTIPNSSSLQLTTAMTLEAWIDPSIVGSTWRDVIYKGKDNYFLEATSSHLGKPVGGGKIGGTTNVSVTGTVPTVANAWTHLAVTYNGSALVLYVNGTPVTSTPVTGTILTSVNPLQIGSDSFFGQYFDGSIDEIRVYNTALTQAQIQTDMVTPIGSSGGDLQKPTPPTNLAASAVSSSEIDLSWTASTDNVGVTGYLVERCPGAACSNFAQVGTTSNTTFNDTGLSPGTSYSYRVRATDAANNLSDYSNVASATTQGGGPTGLVAAYSFNEGSGTTVTDASANGNAGTISNASWTSGKYGGALAFNGSSSRVTIPNAPTLQLTSGMTLEAWVNPTTVSSLWRDVIYKGKDNYFLEATSSRSSRPVGGAILNGTNAAATGPTPLTAGTFTHLAATYNGSTMRLFVNGTQVASTPGTGSILTSANALQIGSDSNFGQYFTGTIDEVRVYNTALTQAQIQTDMATPIGSGGALSITPKAAALTFTRTQQFTAQGAGGTVTWSVDGVVGGTSSTGTITSQGLYTPPSSIGTHTVTASASAQTANATVYITNMPGVYLHHYDTMRTGANLQETVLTPPRLTTSTFGKVLTYPLDGYTFASPLYVANVNVPGQGFHNIVYVATEHDSVYAFDADGVTSTPIWHRSFIDPANGVTTVPSTDVSSVPDIPVEIGITATPVIDPATNTMYVLVLTKEVSGGTTSYVYRLHALNIVTGAETITPAVVQGSVPGTGLGSVNGTLTFNSLRENGRPGLLLSNGVVYIGFGSHTDVEPFHGWVFGYGATTLQRVFMFCTTPNSDDGGVWMSGAGFATDSTGSIYFVSGDGGFDAGTGGLDYGDTVLRMSPAGAVVDYFSPANQATLDTNNQDLGAGGVVLLPDQPGPHPHELVASGKGGTLYLIDRDNMTHYNPAMDQNIQSIVLGHPNFSNPVYFNGNLYISPINTGIQAYQFSNGQLSSSPTSHTVANYDKRGGTIAVSASGTSNGIVWALQSNNDSASVLRAYSPGNLGTELWNSSLAGTRDTLGPWMKFSLPVIANGKVFVATDSQLVIYGLLP
jgi:chitodextrinase